MGTPNKNREKGWYDPKSEYPVPKGVRGAKSRKAMEGPKTVNISVRQRLTKAERATQTQRRAKPTIASKAR